MGLLRTTARRGLAAVGLAPAREVSALRDRAADERNALDKARAEAREWKARAESLTEQGRAADQLASRLAKAERKAQRADRYRTELLEARQRIERAEKAIAQSREHLMATETKLDLVDAAIAVLDRRTRA